MGLFCILKSLNLFFSMKTIKYFPILCLSCSFLFFSCEDFIGGDFNADPNNPIEVPVTSQFPAIQINLADVYGGEFSRNSCIIMQQAEGVARSWNTFYLYTGILPTRFNTVWQNIYENILNEIKLAKANAQKDNFNHHLGVLNILEAYTLMITTDVWDAIPYTEANQGIDNINPNYDSQSLIYTAIYQLLDEGVSLLEGESGVTTIGLEDVYYQGDIQRWIKAAHGIKARGLIKDKDYAAAASEVRQSFESSDDNLGYQYPDVNAAAPWYRFNRDRTGDIEFPFGAGTLNNIMESLNDTLRLEIMNQPFSTNHSYLVANFHQELITYREVQFILAETDFRLNNGGTEEGYNAYLAGIKGSFDEFGLEETTYNEYISQNAVAPGVGNLTIEHIIHQKYIGLWLCPEVYSDYRRTVFPDITPVSGNFVPVRWQYPATEFLFNENAPLEGSINIFTDKVGWDD